MEAKVREGFQGKPLTPEDYGRWHTRVRQLRADLRAKGIKLETPEPVDLSGQEAPADTGKVMKWTAIGTLVIGGVVAVSALLASGRRAPAPREYRPYGDLASSY